MLSENGSSNVEGAVNLWVNEITAHIESGLSYTRAKAKARLAVINRYGSDMVYDQQYNSQVGHAAKKVRRGQQPKTQPLLFGESGKRVSAKQVMFDWFCSLKLEAGDKIVFSPSLLAQVSGYTTAAWKKPFYLAGRKDFEDAGYEIEASGSDDWFEVVVLKAPPKLSDEETQAIELLQKLDANSLSKVLEQLKGGAA